jgi:DsbC/DsbD-like thiol-disulfide interchange protein
MTILPRKVAAWPAGLLASLLLALLPASAAAAGEASPWAEGHRSRVRLVAGGSEAGGVARLAGIEMALDAGFKTYWRTPGESGLPPAFDWSGSENLAKADVLWPAPSRFEDAGGVSYGYKDQVVLPVRAIAKDSSKPVRLRLRLDYGVCKDICIPAQATLALELPGGEAAHGAAIEKALARVPKPQPLGAPGDLSVLGLEPTRVAGKPALAVAVRAPPDADLFVEGPDTWYLGAKAMQAGTEPGSGEFVVEVFDRPKDATGRLGLRLTLVAGGRAVEATASLDLSRLPR